ncbi:MAG: Ger(x)C family spore germination protein [Bacillota bacterium]
MNINKSLILMIMIIYVFCLSGCWGYTEVNEYGIVMLTAVDIDDEGLFKISVLVSVPSTIMQQQGTVSTMWIGAGRGPSIADAAQNLIKIAPKKLTWIQNNAIIFGEKAARNSLGDIMDFFVRSREIRLDNYVMVSEGLAGDLFQVPADAEKNLYTEMEGIIRNAERWSRTYISDLKDFMMQYANVTSDAVAARIGSYKSERNTFSTTRESMGGEKKGKNKEILYIVGSAVFKDGKLVGWLDGVETRGFQWFIDKIDMGTIEHADIKKNEKAILEIRTAKTDVKPTVKEGRLVYEVKVHATGNLIEVIGKVNIMDKAKLKEIEEKFAKVVEEEMRLAVQKAQKKYKADIFLFGDKLYRSLPSVWREVEDRWGEVFPEVEVAFDIKVEVKTPGEILNNYKLNREM